MILNHLYIGPNIAFWGTAVGRLRRLVFFFNFFVVGQPCICICEILCDITLITLTRLVQYRNTDDQQIIVLYAKISGKC